MLMQHIGVGYFRYTSNCLCDETLSLEESLLVLTIKCG